MIKSFLIIINCYNFNSTNINNMIINLNISFLDKFKEFDREVEPWNGYFLIPGTDINELEKDIKLNGIKFPLELTILGLRKALLTEGNHRLAVAKRLNITRVPVKLKFNFPKILLKYKKEKFVNIF